MEDRRRSDHRFWALLTVGSLLAFAVVGSASIVALQITQAEIDRGLATVLIGFLGVMSGQVVTYIKSAQNSVKLDETDGKLGRKMEEVRGGLENLTNKPDATEKKS